MLAANDHLPTDDEREHFYIFPGGGAEAVYRHYDFYTSLHYDFDGPRITERVCGGHGEEYDDEVATGRHGRCAQSPDTDMRVQLSGVD